jgi:hypothetical protein
LATRDLLDVYLDAQEDSSRALSEDSILRSIFDVRGVAWRGVVGWAIVD